MKRSIKYNLSSLGLIALLVSTPAHLKFFVWLENAKLVYLSSFWWRWARCCWTSARESTLAKSCSFWENCIAHLASKSHTQNLGSYWAIWCLSCWCNCWSSRESVSDNSSIYQYWNFLYHCSIKSSGTSQQSDPISSFSG